MADRMLRAVTGFVTADRVTVKGGQLVAANDPVVKGREVFFVPADASIEQATRPPGERQVSVEPPDTVIAAAEAAGRRTRKASS